MLEIYNTMTREKELFKSRGNNRINFFVCGPTVYEDAHIGHGRTYVAFDLIKRYLEYKGYAVFLIENITDVDDKIIQKSKEKEIDFKSISNYYEKRFKEDMDLLNVNSVNAYPKTTDYINEMLDQIQRLIDKGYAYETSEGIYFEVSKFSDFGKLSNQDLNKQKSRLQNENLETHSFDSNKKNIKDIALWKKTEEEPNFDSKWGKGRPAWHIEDTAITEEFFGQQYDIHGGGLDLIFPHHEAEVAQMEALSNKKPMVKYWMHTGFLNVNGVKMSKSLNNFITIRDLLEKWDPMVFRLFVLSTHYRTRIDFSEKSLDQAEKNLKRLKNTIQKLIDFKKDLDIEDKLENNELLDKLYEVKNNFFKDMDDDINTSKALADILNFTKVINGFISEHESNPNKNSLKFINETLAFYEDVESIFKLNLFYQDLKEDKGDYDDLLKILLETRDKLRQEKNYELSDYIRDKINDLGISIEDK